MYICRSNGWGDEWLPSISGVGSCVLQISKSTRKFFWWTSTCYRTKNLHMSPITAPNH